LEITICTCSVLTVAPLTLLISIVRFIWSQNPSDIIDNNCDIVEKVGDIGISMCVLIPSWSSTVVVSVNSVNNATDIDKEQLQWLIAEIRGQSSNVKIRCKSSGNE